MSKRAILVANVDDVPVPFPISTGTARELTHIVLQSEPIRAETDLEALAIALRHDAGFLAWSLLHKTSQTFAELAAWLGDSGREVLLDFTTEAVQIVDRDDVTEARILQLATQSNVAANAQAVDHDCDAMAALLYDWEAWAVVGRSETDLGELVRERAELSMGLDMQAVVDRERFNERAASSALLASPALSPEVAGMFDDIWRGDSAWHQTLVQVCGLLGKEKAGELAFQQRLEKEKLLSMKQLAYGASHEINNPLANIASRAQTLLMDELDPQRRRTLTIINEQAFRAHEMIADMMLFANPPRMEVARVDLAVILEELVDVVSDLSKQNRVSVVLDVGQAIWVEVDPTQFLVALRAICVNGLEAMPAGGRLTIRARLPEPTTEPPTVQTTDSGRSLGDDDKSNDQAEICIRDNGPGIPSEVRRHLFDPFYSGREAGRGLGFGLSKAWRIVGELGGELVTSSPPTGGTEFIVKVPVSQPIVSQVASV